MWIFTEIWYFKYGILFPKVTQYGITKWYFYLNMGLQNMAFPIWYLFSKILKIWYFQYGIFFVKIKDMVFSLWHFILEILKYGFLKYGKKKPLGRGQKKLPGSSPRRGRRRAPAITALFPSYTAQDSCSLTFGNIDTV